MASAAEIAGAAIRAGWSSSADHVKATAIALAESSGNPRAHAVNSREDSRGLWQINVKAHPEFASVDLYDIDQNARAAYAVYQKQGWGAWSVYNSKAYLLYVPTATAGSAAAEAGQIPGDIAGIPGKAADAAGAATADATGAYRAGIRALLKTEHWLTDGTTWVRVAQVLIGGVVVVVGLNMLVGKEVGPVAAKVAKAVV